jgi:hypothetical protein
VAILFVAASASLPTTVAAQPIPLGPPFEVGVGGDPAIASNGSDKVLVVWSGPSSGSDSDGASIQGRFYDGSGTPLGGQFQVNSFTTGGQGAPAVDGDGTTFVVVWESEGSAGSDSDGLSIQGQRYDATAGTPLGGEFQVNVGTVWHQRRPAVGLGGGFGPGGFFNGFKVAWENYAQPDISARDFESSGLPITGDFPVGSQYFSSEPAMSHGSAFIVVWTQPENVDFQPPFYNTDIHGFTFGKVSREPDYANQASPAVDSAVTVWVSVEQDGSGASRVEGRLGLANPPKFFQVAQDNSPSGPVTVAMGPQNFVVVWNDLNGLQGQLFHGNATPHGGQFQVSPSSGSPAMAVDSDASFFVVWDGVSGRRFGFPSTTTTLPTTDRFPGRVTVIKAGVVARFVAKPVTGDTFDLPTSNPVTAGGSLRIFDTGVTAGDNTYNLPTTGWVGLGNPAGSRGYKYTGAGTATDPCRVVLVKSGVAKGVCKGDGITLAPPFMGDVGIVLTLGNAERYCGRLGGEEVRNDTALTKRKNAPAPGACP